jgi:hypothetical protein
VDARLAAMLSEEASALLGAGVAGLLPGDAVDAVWALAKLGHPVPTGWWDLLPYKLANRCDVCGVLGLVLVLPCHTA